MTSRPVPPAPTTGSQHDPRRLAAEVSQHLQRRATCTLADQEGRVRYLLLPPWVALDISAGQLLVRGNTYGRAYAEQRLRSGGYTTREINHDGRRVVAVEGR